MAVCLQLTRGDGNVTSHLCCKYSPPPKPCVSQQAAGGEGGLYPLACVCACARRHVELISLKCVRVEKKSGKSTLTLSLLSHISLPYNVLPIHAMPFKGMVGIVPQTGTKLNMLMPSKGAMEGEKT